MSLLPLPSFDLARPTSIDEAVRLLAEPGARALAGGTDLLPNLKYGLLAPARLVALNGLAELRRIETLPDGTLRLGAGCTLARVGTHPDVRARFPALAAACGTVATPTIQNMATLGGNLLLDTRCTWYNQPAGWRDAIGGCLKCDGTVCHVAPRGKGCYAAQSADTVPVLWLYDAVAELVSEAGTRRVPVRELVGGDDGRTPNVLRAGELLVAVELPGEALRRGTLTRLAPSGASSGERGEDASAEGGAAPGAASTGPLPRRSPSNGDREGAGPPPPQAAEQASPPRVAFRKGRARGALDYGWLLVAVRRDVEASGGVTWRAVISGTGPRLVEVSGASVEALAEAAHDAVQPLGTHLENVPWRKAMVRVEVRRAADSLL